MLCEFHRGFPGGSAGKESSCNVGDLSSIPWFGKIPRRRVWQPAPVFLPGKFHGVAESQTQLSNFNFHGVQ